jgi:hypothetical protein
MRWPKRLRIPIPAMARTEKQIAEQILGEWKKPLLFYVLQGKWRYRVEQMRSK